MSSMISTSGSGAHPRSRGENNNRPVIGLVTMGSSPLTRGKRTRAIRGRGLPGLIPAHAGKTGLRRFADAQSSAHPRSRGENTVRDLWPPLKGGSSPLTRGKPVDDCFHGGGRGLIPAHAGKTRSSAPTTRSSRAHPRSRGENLHTLESGVIHRGSSPLTRGKLFHLCPEAR